MTHPDCGNQTCVCEQSLPAEKGDEVERVKSEAQKLSEKLEPNGCYLIGESLVPLLDAITALSSEPSGRNGDGA